MKTLHDIARCWTSVSECICVSVNVSRTLCLDLVPVALAHARIAQASDLLQSSIFKLHKLL